MLIPRTSPARSPTRSRTIKSSRPGSEIAHTGRQLILNFLGRGRRVERRLIAARLFLEPGRGAFGPALSGNGSVGSLARTVRIQNGPGCIRSPARRILSAEPKGSVRLRLRVGTTLYIAVARHLPSAIKSHNVEGLVIRWIALLHTRASFRHARNRQSFYFRTLLKHA